LRRAPTVVVRREERHVAEIFVSYTSSDRDWAFWIGHELEALGHRPRIHEWELSGGADIMAWMEAQQDTADHVLCVVSEKYLKAPYSSLERHTAQWAAVTHRPNFALPVFVEECKVPVLFATTKRCDLYGVAEDEAFARLESFLTPATKPPRGRFPGGPKPSTGTAAARTAAPFPGKATAPPPTMGVAIANIPITVPRHFLGRDHALAAIDAALARADGRAAITALHGLRGVGKTTLAAAYAERHRGDYQATWWIRAQTDSSMRADLVALGVRLGWVAADEKEEPALGAIMERLRNEGDGVLLIFDNAVDPTAIRPYLPRGDRARVLVTSNFHAWHGIAAPVEIEEWPKEVGADFLLARTGHPADERAAAEALSETLGGLPLAHEQAGAYCERLGVSFADYRRRFLAAPVRLLDYARGAPAEHNDGLTAAKSFALAIDEAAKLHPAAEPLIVHAALLAPESIPLFLFSEAREEFGEPLASALAGDGLDEAVAALRAFALVDRDSISDAREPAITTDTIRLHRVVREVAAARRTGEAREDVLDSLVMAMTAVYPRNLQRNSNAWPQARRLDALALALVDGDKEPPVGMESQISYLASGLAHYRRAALGDYAQSRLLYERALAIDEKVFGPEHPETAAALNNLASLLEAQGDLVGARPLSQRALEIAEKALGPEHPNTAIALNNLAGILRELGDLPEARNLLERALAIHEKVVGPEHPSTAIGLNNLAGVLLLEGDLAKARLLRERALSICEKVLGLEHPQTALSLSNLASLLINQNDPAGARPLFERALSIREKVLGPEHPDTANSLNSLAVLLVTLGDLAGAQRLFERALSVQEKVLGPEHPRTTSIRRNLALLRARNG
jgi:tetratricopeptide (TPR) repeat protein